jgi:hypothetical protein
MNRSRVLLTSSFSLVALGAVLALSTFVLGPARAAVGPLPAEGLSVPADTRVLMGFDVARLVKSPLYTRMKAERGVDDPFRELRDKLGLDPERDIETVVVAAGSQGGRGVVLAFGRFDRHTLAREVEKHKGVTWKQHAGTTVYLFDETSRSSGALAFLSDEVVVAGERGAVERTVGNHQNGTTLRSNTQLMALLGRVKPGSAFWMAGDQSALSRLPLQAPAPGGGGGRIELPALQGVTVTGEVDPALNLDVVGDAADPAAAAKLADVVRGLVALMTLQAGQKPELQQLAAAVSVTTEGKHVRVGLRLPYDLLDTLKGAGKPAPTAQATR